MEHRPFRENAVLTLSQEENQRKELEREEREARELKERPKAGGIFHLFRR